MRKEIDTAPRNGDFVILEDDVSGTYAVARWSAEAAQWLDDEGTPSQLNATHWHLPQTAVAPVNKIEPLADPRISRKASGGVTAQPQRAAKQGRSGNASAGFVGSWNFLRRRSILTMAACLLAGAAIGPLLYHDDLGELLVPWVAASETETGLKHALRQEQELATKLASDATAARSEAELQAALLRQAGEAASREKEAGERTIVQLRQALQLELAKAEKLAGELAEAQRDRAVQTSLTHKAIDEAARAEAERERITGELRQALKQQEDKTIQANVRTAEQVALKQERDKAEKLRVELASARREGESRAAILRSASDEATRLKEASARAADELRQALRQTQDKAEKLAGELTAARQEVEAKTAAAGAARDEARRAVETNKRSTEEQGQALREAQDKAEKLTAELVATQKEVETQTAAARAASDEARRAVETSKRSRRRARPGPTRRARQSREARG